MDDFGSLLSAGASLLGGFLGKSSADASRDAQMQMANNSIQMQKDFAQQGVRWKEADATAGEEQYGINRLVAMGAPTASFAPVSVGDTSNNSLGAGVAAAGQDIGRAAQAYAGANSRETLLKNRLLEAQIANVNSDTVKNQAAASKIATNAPTTPPPLWQDYSDGKGGVIRLPSTKASSSMQNWASLPAQLSVAGSEAGNAIQYEYHKLADPIVNWVKSHGSVPVRGDAARSVSRDQWIAYPWN